MRILALDSAAGACSACVVADSAVMAQRQQITDRGQTALLPEMARACLSQAGLRAPDLDLVAVTVGPGSFTGIRGAVALAQGIAAGAGVPAIGVTVGEAIASALPLLGGRSLWVATHARRGRIFLERDGRIDSLALADLPLPAGPIAIAGNEAAEVASRLAARGASVMLTDAAQPLGRHIAAVAERRFRGEIGPLAPEPLYVDAPEARPRAGQGPDRVGSSRNAGSPRL